MNTKKHWLRGCGIAAVLAGAIGGAPRGVGTGTLTVQATVLHTCRIDAPALPPATKTASGARRAPMALDCTAGSSYEVKTSMDGAVPNQRTATLTVTYLRAVTY